MPVNLPVSGHIQLMWRCVCSTAGFGCFPRRGHGLDDNDQPPAFQSKKASRLFFFFFFLTDTDTDTDWLAGCSVLFICI